jgi:hypothetical protein
LERINAELEIEESGAKQWAKNCLSWSLAI